MDSEEGGVVLQVVAIGMAIVFLLSGFVILFFVKYQKRLLTQQSAHQQKEASYQKELLQAAISSQETERNRIGKELHDDIGAMLTTTKIYATQISADLDAHELDTVTKKMTELFDGMIQSTRRISQDLRPVILEKLGLIEGIMSLIKTINESGVIRVDLKHDAENLEDKLIELNTYRIIQELLTNTIKHASATEVKIELGFMDNRFTLMYQDNGDGMDQGKSMDERGIGLKNIESRVSAIEGTIMFLEAEKGVNILMEVPIEK